MGLDAAARQEYLDLFIPSKRSLVANIYKRIIRGQQTPLGVALRTDPEVIRDMVRDDCNRRIAAEMEWQRGHWSEAHDVTINALEAILGALKSTLCTRYIEHTVAEEQLPPEERARRKGERGGPYRRAAGEVTMAGQLPTDAQRAFLARLGYSGAVRNKLHASKIISAIKHGATPEVIE